MNIQRLIDYLQSTYDEPLLERKGITYPVIPFYPSPEQRNNLDSLLLHPYPEIYAPKDSFAFYDTAHLQALQAEGRTLTNDITYIMNHLETNPLRISAHLGHYFDMIATCDSIDHELRHYAHGEHADLPYRTQLHQLISPRASLFNGRGRSAIVGVAVLTVFAAANGYQAIVIQRARNLGVGAGLFHVFPAFVFQPSGPSAFFQAEWSLHHQVLREFGEELFAMPEYANWENADYFYDYPPVKELRQMLASGNAALYLTGIAMNLFTLRPEITSLLLIHDPDWFVRNQDKLQLSMTTERQQTRYISIDTLDGLPDNLIANMTPQGTMAFWTGIDLARELLEP